MGKASRWIRSFLVGKKEDDFKKKDASVSTQNSRNAMVILKETPKVKRRWSFGRSTAKQRAHNYSKSIDSFDTALLAIRAMGMSENEQNCNVVVAKKRATEETAATKIQALFRSHLARKALCALRGLVKVQALVRGHLVRKRTNATLRCMQSLMSIQVRARVQRIQMAEEEKLGITRRPSIHTNSPVDNQFKNASNEVMDMNFQKTKESSKSHRSYLNSPQTSSTEVKLATLLNRNLSVPKQERPEPQLLISSPSLSTSSNMRLRTCNREYKPSKIDHNYMSKTECSSGKVRSQSEPKQRPQRRIRQRSTRTASREGIGVSKSQDLHYSYLQLGTTIDRSRDPWLIDLYRSTLTNNARNF